MVCGFTAYNGILPHRSAFGFVKNSTAMENKLQERVEALMASRGIGPSETARLAGLDDTFIKDLRRGKKRQILPENLFKLARGLNTTMEFLIGESDDPYAPGGFAEDHGTIHGRDDVLPYFAEEGSTAARLIDTAVGGRKDVSAWRIETTVLAALGWLPGDVLVAATRARPEPGNIVIAQRYEYDLGRSRTILRQFRPPFLFSAPPMAAAAEAIPVEGGAFAIEAVCEVQFRVQAG